MFSSENFTSNQKFWAICDLIKNFEESLYLWHTWTWTWTCDTLVANSSHAAKHNCQVFLFLFQMFAAFQILETPTLFCVFVPFVFKLWLSGSILHLSSNLVPLTRLASSNHMLYKKNWLGTFIKKKHFGMSYSHHLICNISAEPWVSGSAGN